VVDRPVGVAVGGGGGDRSVLLTMMEWRDGQLEARDLYGVVVVSQHRVAARTHKAGVQWEIEQ